jgi:hypothetical protein
VSRSPQKWLWAFALSLGLLATGALLWPYLPSGPAGVDGQTEVTHAQTPAASIARPDFTPDAGTATPSPAAATLTVSLLPDAGVGADPASLRIGVARITPEARSRHLLWLQDGSRGAGPSELSELAEVEQWLTPRGTLREDGRVDVGPVQLPEADRYIIQARGTDGLRFYRASFLASAVPTQLSPVVAAGLQIESNTVLPAGARLQLLRREPLSDPALWQRLMAEEAPHLRAAFDEEGLALAGRTQWLPLPPARFEAVLSIGAVEAERRPVQLLAGHIVQLRFDPARVEVAAERSVDLELFVSSAADGAAIEDAEVRWTLAGVDRSATTDHAGRVLLKAIDRAAPLNLELRLTRTLKDELPLWPERHLLELRIDDEVADAEARFLQRRVEVEPLRWLIVAGEARRTGPPSRGQPYPVHVLQQWKDDRWQELSAEQFMPLGRDLAASIEAPGRYRVAAARSPWSLGFTTPTDFGSTNADRQFATVTSVPGRSVRLQLQGPDGLPLRRHPVQIVGALTGLPPVQVETDQDGLLTLQGANVEPLFLEPHGHEMQGVMPRQEVSAVRFQVVLP